MVLGEGDGKWREGAEMASLCLRGDRLGEGTVMPRHHRLHPARCKWNRSVGRVVNFDDGAGDVDFAAATTQEDGIDLLLILYASLSTCFANEENDIKSIK